MDYKDHVRAVRERHRGEIQLFTKMTIETHSACNRSCYDCLRQNNPLKKDKKRKQIALSEELINKALLGAKMVGYQGEVALNGYCEPLLDLRLPTLAILAIHHGLKPYICTNGDLLDEVKAKELDGLLSKVVLASYDQDTREQIQERRDRIASYFEHTEVTFASKRLITHFSPRDGYEQLRSRHRPERCMQPLIRFMLLHTGDMAICCEDINGGFGLGNIRYHTVEELWWSKKHQDVAKALAKSDSRKNYYWCWMCPMGSRSQAAAQGRASHDDE